MSPTMEEIFEANCAARTIPGAVLISMDKSGKFNYRRAFGIRSMEGPEGNEPLAVDSTMWFASCTKLITSIAAMQCVERGLITLDEDVRTILYELNDVDILVGNNDGKLVSKYKNTASITLRQLLTHTAGMAFDFNDPLLQQWRSQQPENDCLSPTSVRGRFLHPLLYEPGTSWRYSPSIDWTGVLIERITHSALQDYMIKNIWEPLGIRDMTFFLSTRPELRARMASMSLRTEEPAAAYHPNQPSAQPDMEDAQGGGGLITSAPEYMKVLHALLLASDPSASDAATVPLAQLLRRSTVETMFTPQLNHPGLESLKVFCEDPRFNVMMGGISGRADWGLGGLLIVDGDWRRTGTMIWGGMPNLNWWIDREAGLCGLYATQIMPVGDAKSVEMMHVFQKAMYERFEKESFESDGFPASYSYYE